MQEFATICERAARAGGQILLQWRDRVVARAKAPSDLVTQADLASQEAIREIVLGAFPEHAFLGEEQLDGESTEHDGSRPPAATDAAGGYRWLVDPLDGTTNYVHTLDHYCVSVALERHGQLLVAAVFDPVKGECFTAQAGQGAYLNRQRLSTSGAERLDEALVAVSFSPEVRRGSAEIERFVEILHRCRATRRMGSAALNLCYVAAGRLDAYWATTVKAWDIAAGVLLVREAGGVVSATKGGELDLNNPKLAAAASPELHGQLLAALEAWE
jgi:myo-inositol-1(or 4)-monophosphatase